MNPCRQWEPWIKATLAGDVPAPAPALLMEHARSCRACEAILALHGYLDKEGPAVRESAPVPSDAEFRAMRRAVLDTILPPDAGAPVRSSFFRDLATLFHVHSWVTAGSAVVLLTCVFLLGRWSVSSFNRGPAGLVREIESQASGQTDLAGHWDAPYIYSNISLRTRERGRLALSFDVTRHVSLTAQEDSPLAREVMVHAILDPSTIAPRLKAISLAEHVADDRLKEALIFILINDSNQAVRLKALSALTQYPFDLDIEAAMLRSLRDDDAVQVRLQAIDCLAARKVDPEAIRQAIGEANRPGDAAARREAALQLRL